MTSRSWPLVALALLLCGGPGASAQELVKIRRLNDSVAVRTGPERTERHLYFFDPDVELAAGDELEQGSGGQSTMVLTGGGLVQLYASCHVIIETLSEAEDVLRFPILTHAEVTSGTRALTLWLPGGNKVSFQGTTVSVRVVPGRMRVRNEGGTPVEVEGVITLDAAVPGGDGRSTVVLARGEEVHLPLFPVTPGPLGGELSSWEGRALRHSGGIALELEPGRLSVRSATPESKDMLLVGGVRIRPEPGVTLVITGGHRGPPGVEPLPPEAAPPGLTAVGAVQYYELRQAGHTDEELEANGLWVPDHIRKDYEQRASRQQGAAAEETDTETTEGS